MWNTKHDVYGWDLDRHSETENPNPCAKCKHFIEEYPYCDLSPFQSTMCGCDGKLQYFEEL